MVGAAAPQDGRHWTLNDAKEKFVELKEQCRHFDSLEDDITKFASDASVAAEIISEINVDLTSAQVSAMNSILEDIEDAQDAFADYVRTRRRRPDDEHVIGRSNVGKALRKCVQDMIDYLDSLSLP
jgi:hypothetical protein